ncbi:MAG: fluoride efflux transporter CrcB [Elusimicrobia bacterium]|nr:fluoride efflux transporter CrcB [Elusimicrobiota bacterium]MDE2312697.1 fluoride efflux transporter CrcB [Elusimicrobiota bacterium]
MENALALVVGSVAGGFARWSFSGRVGRMMGGGFPWGTFVVNLSACFLIGLFDSLAEVRFALSPAARILLMTGFCGAYSTFSTFILETAKLLQSGQPALALANFFGSGLAGIALFWFGAALGRV